MTSTVDAPVAAARRRRFHPLRVAAVDPLCEDAAAITFEVPAELAADALVRAVKGADKANIVSARVFDLFEKDGEKSVAVEVVLQPGEKSFTDAGQRESRLE